ncbi:MAG TPA: transglycosylase SLT domain-containing protein [Methylomirabilota bacterium]|nr:transglycosylase SLT domain-containing protein [Methylomirabilota bacterium]
MLGRHRERIRLWSDPVGRMLFRLRLRPNHLTVIGLVVSFFAAAAFIAGHVRGAGGLLLLAGLCDLLDGSLARMSGQVTAFGAFLDSVIDRYSDLIVLLGIVVLFARTPNARGALVAMAGLVGSVMVSYTKARAESIGVECNVGVMERPERMICLIAGAVLDLLEPALWVLAALANLTALQRIIFTRRMMTESSLLPAALLSVLLLPGLAAAAEPPRPARVLAPETERAWAEAIAAYQQGDPAPVVAEVGDAALRSPIGDHLRLIVADALARRGDFVGARAMAAGVAERHPGSRLAPRGLLMAATLAARAGDDKVAQAALARLLDAYPEAREVPVALYLLGQTAEARGRRDDAAHAYRELLVQAPTTGWADGATDRLAVLAATGTPMPPLTLDQRLDRAERLLRGGVPKTAADEAQRIAGEARDPSIVVRALRVVADGARRLGRYEAAASALALAIPRAPAERQAGLRLEEARLLIRAGRRERALEILGRIASTGSEADAAEALWLRARTLEDAQRPVEATAAYRALATRYPKREVAGDALWRLGWSAYLRGDAREAAGHWSRLAQVSGNRAYRLAALYWHARATEDTRDRTAAAPLYAKVLTEAPRSYYGILALARVGEAGDAARPTAVTLPADPVEAVADDPGFARVDLLRRLGLVESALEELEEVVQQATGDTVRLYGFSSAYVRDERYHLALRIFRRHFASLAASGDPALPRAFWEMLYPFGWRSEVTAAAQRAGLDPFLVAAVVREESSYYPRALSRAGARGLMQLMPATARPMAEHRGLAFAGGELLDDPGANLEIGTAFLAGLLREFKDPRLALAAYNAGPARLRQWLQARRTGDLEAFVEQIPFDETRQYVKRVMLSWEEYRRLYSPRDP